MYSTCCNYCALGIEAFVDARVNKGILWFDFLSVKGLKSYILMSTVGADHPLNGPSLPMMMFSENLRYNTKGVSKYLPRIISYLLLVDLAT